jgi:hypothetical protein
MDIRRNIFCDILIGTYDAYIAPMPLKYFHCSGYKISVNTCLTAIDKNDIECFKYAASSTSRSEIAASSTSRSEKSDTLVCAYAATKNDVEYLKIAHENGWSWDGCTTTEAAFQDNIECLKYACENGCPIGKFAYVNAKPEGKKILYKCDLKY